MSDLARADRAHVLHAISEWRHHESAEPRIVTGGKGVRLAFADGRTAIDGLSGLVNINAGHGRTEIRDAVAAQMGKLAYYPSFWDFSNEPAIRLAERLAGLFPADREIDHFLFVSGGSEANEMAFRLARLYQAVRGRPERRKIVSRHYAFHGITRAAGSATRLPAYHVFEEPDPLHLQAAAPYCFRCDLDLELPACGVACADDVGRVIEEAGAESVAAVIAEPALGTAGMVLPPPGYFDRLQEICRDTGVILVADEVITGFGRTGRWFGMEHWGLRPDIVTFAKGVTSGYLPLGGVGLSRRVYEAIRDESPRGLPFMGGLTYNHHATCCAAALANLDILEREGLVENSARVGEHLLGALRARFDGEELVGEIRGLGLFCAVEWGRAGTRQPVARPLRFPAAVAREAWERGLIVRAFWECTGVAPPLCATIEDADEIVAILGEAYEAARRSLGV